MLYRPSTAENEARAELDRKIGPFRAEIVPDASLCWHIVRTTPGQEDNAARFLEAPAIGLFLPRFVAGSRMVLRNEPIDLGEKLIFPGKLFVFVWGIFASLAAHHGMSGRAVDHVRRRRAASGGAGRTNKSDSTSAGRAFRPQAEAAQAVSALAAPHHDFNKRLPAKLTASRGELSAIASSRRRAAATPATRPARWRGRAPRGQQPTNVWREPTNPTRGQTLQKKRRWQRRHNSSGPSAKWAQPRCGVSAAAGGPGVAAREQVINGQRLGGGAACSQPHGSNQQMFGAQQQVPQSGFGY